MEVGDGGLLNGERERCACGRPQHSIMEDFEDSNNRFVDKHGCTSRRTDLNAHIFHVHNRILYLYISSSVCEARTEVLAS